MDRIVFVVLKNYMYVPRWKHYSIYCLFSVLIEGSEGLCEHYSTRISPCKILNQVAISFRRSSKCSFSFFLITYHNSMTHSLTYLHQLADIMVALKGGTATVAALFRYMHKLDLILSVFSMYKKVYENNIKFSRIKIVIHII